MSDATPNSTVLDPDRPWISDERQLPSRMSWMDSLFNPAGASPKLHFTRVWTVCFFLQFFIVVIPFGLGILISLAGGNPAPVKTLGLYASPIVFIVTTIISFVAHSRRLIDAKKPSIFAIIVLLPLLGGLAVSGAGIMKSSAEYDKLYAERAVYLENPDAWREAQLEKRQVAQAEMQARKAEAEANAEAGGGEAKPAQRGQQRGGPGQGMRGPRADQPLPSQLSFILKPNVGIIQLVLFVANIFILIWSLMWVARVPDFGKSKNDGSGAGSSTQSDDVFA